MLNDVRDLTGLTGDHVACLARAGRVSAIEYNWGGDDGALRPPLDVVLVSDCLLPKLYPIEPLVDALDKLSGPDTAILVSYEPR